MKKVLVKSMLGLLGDLENRVCCLHGTGFDEATLTSYAEVSLEPTGKVHKIALEHIAVYLEDDTKVTANPTLEVKAIDVQVGGGHYKSKGIQPLEYIFQYTTIL